MLLYINKESWNEGFFFSLNVIEKWWFQTISQGRGNHEISISEVTHSES